MAQWDTAFINDLPDSSFLYVEPGGQKDSEGKTTPRSLRHFPVKDASGSVDLPHLRNALARIPQSSLSSDLKSRLSSKAQAMLQAQNRSAVIRPDSFVRAGNFDFDLQRETGNGKAVMSGQLAVFNDWTEISSPFEGHFMERLSPSAFDKTIQENGERMKVLFQHGRDPAVGQKPLGRILDLSADDKYVRYQVELLSAPYVDDLIPGLEAGLYGASFRASDIKSKTDKPRSRSDHNPQRLPEVTRLELKMHEFGPVTFPAYADTSARMRSMTDDFMLPGLRQLVEMVRGDVSLEGAAALAEVSEPEPQEESTQEAASRSTQEQEETTPEEEMPSWRLRQ